ncbi:hypothetical protein D3C73_1555100 [compost metagenome]
MQQVEIVLGELRAAVVAFGVGREGLRQLGEGAVGGVTHGVSSLNDGVLLRPYSYG